MRKGIVLLVLVMIVAGCKKKSTPAPSPAPDYTPAKTLLIFPVKDEACITGTSVSSTTSSVVFSWNSAINAETYEVNIKNLTTGVYMSAVMTSNTQMTITLLKNTPYSWYITSKSSKTNTTTQSDVWKFYNSGPGVVSHPPFPADLLAPTFGQNIVAVSGKITLSWSASDVDNDIVSYDVYFGNNSSPPLLQSGVATSTLSNVSVISNAPYYWKIVTMDSQGNTSFSAIYQFSVN